VNINGHEVERRDCRVWVDGYNTEHAGNSDPYYYTRRAESLRGESARRTREANHLDLVAEFVRREQAEKAAQDAARELDRRANIARRAWAGYDYSWAQVTGNAQELWRNIVRALDADAAEQEALSE